jgi:hypothetical protein
MQRIFREHGLDPKPSSGDGQAKEEPDQEASEKALVDAMLKIKNPAKLMRQIADRHEKLAKLMGTSGVARPETKQPTAKELLSSVKLGKVTVTKDSAVAAVTVAASARNKFSSMPENIEFRRIKNRWYCHIDSR